MQSPGELLAAVVQKYFSVASARWAVALLGNAEFGDLWSWLEFAEDGEDLRFGFTAVLAPSPRLCGKLVFPFKPPPTSGCREGFITHPPGELCTYSWGGKKP